MLAHASRITRAAPLMRLPFRRAGGHAYGLPGGWKTDKELDIINKVTMDHLPKPSGSWEEAYKKTDSKRNVMLLASVVFVGVTVAEMSREGCFIQLRNPADW